MRDVVRDRRGDLEPARAGADHGDTATGQVQVVVPACGVELRSAEGRRPGDVGHLRAVELTDGGDHGTCHDRVLGPVGVADPDRPRAVVVVPHRAEHLGREPDAGFDAVLRHHRLEVGLQLGLLGEVLGPVVARLEAVAVEVVADVDAGAGVGVLPPGATHSRVLLDDGVGDARLFEPYGSQQAGLAAADDHDGERIASRGVRRRRLKTCVATVELHLLEQHRHVLLGHLLGDQELHHLVQQLGRDRLRFRTTAVAIVRDDLEGERSGVGLVLLGHEALHLVEEHPRRAQAPADQLRITAHVHERHHERRDAHVEQRLGDLLVGRRERRPGMWVAHVGSPLRCRRHADRCGRCTSSREATQRRSAHGCIRGGRAGRRTT